MISAKAQQQYASTDPSEITPTWPVQQSGPQKDRDKRSIRKDRGMLLSLFTQKWWFLNLLAGTSSPLGISKAKPGRLVEALVWTPSSVSTSTSELNLSVDKISHEKVNVLLYV